MAFRREFRDALSLLAIAVERLTARGCDAPILVGGAAVELYTGGQITSGDFDFVGSKVQFFRELEALGFEHPSEPGWLQWALWHPGLLMAVQVVSGPLMDGRTESHRIRVIEVDTEVAENSKLRVIPVEDLIADRMAQALDGRNVRIDMKNQALRLYQLAEELDRGYLDRRIQVETGNNASLQTLLDWLESNGHEA